MKILKGSCAVASFFFFLAALPGSAAPQTSGSAASDPRIRASLNSDWRFYPDGVNFAEKPGFPDKAWQTVRLPHTWNVSDPFDDTPSYRRGIGWYRKNVRLSPAYSGKKLFLYFEGVNQVATVYVNGAFVGRHRGGYTAFAFDVTSFVKIDPKQETENVVAVQVDNSHDPYLAPLSVGYALYGGIYRDVWLIATDQAHFTVTDYASAGVFVSTKNVSANSATVQVRGSLAHGNRNPANFRITTTVFDSAGTPVSTVSSSDQPAKEWSLVLPQIARPALWSPDRAYLYSVRTELFDGATLVDRVTTPLGFRWFSFDSQQGFMLNGTRLQLKGTNRHQDYQGFGSALSDSLHVRDLALIKKMGANFLRLAHYPQDPAVLDAADRLGLLIWEEIPVVNYITRSPEFTVNSEVMLREMIRQHFNHPSVIMWGIMNEVYLWSPEGFRIRKQADSAYMRSTLAFAMHLDSVARAEDPSRVTAMAVHGSDDYDVSGVSSVAAVLGQNIYSGWYSGVFEDFGKQLDRRHARRPREIIFISEYGAEDDWRVNSLKPERFDFSGTWMKRFHESYLRQINERPWLAGSAIWNQMDFSQPETGGSIPYMNQKGMQTWNRDTKDVFYLYKANWNPEPMVYIASRGWVNRLGTDSVREAGTGPGPVRQPVDVYANTASVELLVNGKSLGVRVPDDVKRATWDVPFMHGINVMEARAATGSRPVSDRLEVRFTYAPRNLRDKSVPWREVAINAGSNAQVLSADGTIWDGDREYTPGSFGFIGGASQMFNKDLAITHHRDTPMFFTYRSGLKAYRFDVPDGKYLVEMRFAEPTATAPGARVFRITANDKVVARGLDLAAQYGLAHAAVISAPVTASRGKGVLVEFTPLKGDAILNAIRVIKQ